MNPPARRLDVPVPRLVLHFARKFLPPSGTRQANNAALHAILNEESSRSALSDIRIIFYRGRFVV
jgi:hypothetical protein